MGSARTRIDELDIDIDSRTALHTYCDRVRKLANDLAIELNMSSHELRSRLKSTPLPEHNNTLSRKWVARKVAAGLWVASEAASAIAQQAIKVAMLFDTYYVNHPNTAIRTDRGKRIDPHA